MTDDLTATLAEIRQNHADSEAARGMWDLSDRADVFYSSVMDIPPLLAALEAALEKAGEWSAESAALEGGHRGLADHGADKLRTAMYARSVALKDCAGQLRDAITTALTGNPAGDEPHTRPSSSCRTLPG